MQGRAIFQVLTGHTGRRIDVSKPGGSIFMGAQGGRVFFRFDMGKFTFLKKAYCGGCDNRTHDPKPMFCHRRHLLRHFVCWVTYWRKTLTNHLPKLSLITVSYSIDEATGMKSMSLRYLVGKLMLNDARTSASHQLTFDGTFFTCATRSSS